MMLIKVNAPRIARGSEATGGHLPRHIIDVTDTSYTIELTARRQTDAFIQSLGKNGIIEVVRSGPSGIARGEKRCDLNIIYIILEPQMNTDDAD